MKRLIVFSFGEMGLIEQIPRQASIQCLSSVEVLKVMPEDFHSIIGSHSTFRKQIEASKGFIKFLFLFGFYFICSCRIN